MPAGRRRRPCSRCCANSSSSIRGRIRSCPRASSEADGKVIGFIGVLPVHMSFRGRKLRAAVPSSIMVDDPQKHPLAGAKLMRAFLNGPQDLSFSEPISPLAQTMWEKAGGETAPSESMEWLRILRPAGLALAFAAGPVPMLGAFRPLARLIDRSMERRGSFKVEPGSGGLPGRRCRRRDAFRR